MIIAEVSSKLTTDRQVKTCSCHNCGSDSKYLSTDVRPVYARERRILQFYGYGPLLTEQVWRSSRATSYFVDGELIRLPGSEQLKADLAAIGDFIADSNHYDAVDVQLLKDYKAGLEINRARLNALEDEAFQFVNSTVKRFPRRMLMVSFSGGKDSTVVL